MLKISRAYKHSRWQKSGLFLSSLACVACVSKKHAKGIKLQASAKNKEQGEGVRHAWMSNFWCHLLMDGLLTNQIVLLLPVRGRMEFSKIFGIDWRRYLFSPPFPTFLLTPGTLPHSPACSLACSIWQPGKGKEMAATQAIFSPKSCRNKLI